MTALPVKVRIENLTVRFGALVGLRGISLDIHEREILSVIGPANSGKSTMLIALNRMVDRIDGAAVSGRVLIDGEDVYTMPDVEELRRRVGMVFALPLPLPLSIRDNILFGPRLKNRFVKKPRADEIIESSLKAAFLWDEVKDRLDAAALNLSGGQQQRLCIARTLALEPEIIMLDEPCSGLDPISTAKVEDALVELKRRHTIILVTNNTKQAARVGDRTAFLLMGDLIEIDATARIFTSPADTRTEQYVTGKFG